MRLEKIRLRDVGPFRDFSVDLTNLGRVVAIVGGNGCGKSTLGEAWGPGALYRTCPTRGSLTSLATSRNASVEATVVNGQRWHITHRLDAVSQKSEAVVTGEDGRPAFDDAKVRSFDAWALKHLPRPEQLFATVFAPQGSEGFLGAKPGDRKAVLLRVLGLERLEEYAERSRVRGREAAARVAETTAAIAEVEPRASADMWTTAVEERRADAETTRAALTLERGRLAELEDEERRVEALRVEGERITAERFRVSVELDAARERLADTERRIANNRAALADAEAIRAAVVEVEGLQRELVDVTAKAAEAKTQRVAANERLSAAIDRRDEAEKRRDASYAELLSVRRALENRQAVDHAVETLPTLKAALANAEHHAREAEIAAAEGLAQRRITGLRAALRRVVDDYSFSPTVAADALAADDQLAADAGSFGAQLRERVTEARAAAQEAREAYERVAALAAQHGSIRDAEQRAADLDSEGVALELALSAMTREVQTLQEECAALGKAHEALAERRHRIDTALERAIPLARRAEPLATAEARLAELGPVADQQRAAVAALTTRLADLPVPPPLPVAPGVATCRATVTTLEAELAEAERALTRAEAALEAALEASQRLAELRARLDAQNSEAADWTRLSRDLGRDGLQAALIDAAGPELSELTNALLHAAFGPRWSVAVETQRLSADGKRQLEGCEVRVLDSQNGRDAAAETYSGGERVILGEAVSLALTALACRRQGVESPTLVRDESGAALSPENGAAYVAMLRRAADLIGADRVLFVSHSPDVVALADSVVEVRSEGVVS